MKRIIVLVCAIFASSLGLADTANFNKLNNLSSVWKSHQTKRINVKNDLAMVYGGSDVSSRPIMHLQSNIS